MPSASQLQDLPLTKTPNEEQLDNIKTHLDLLLLALEALASIGSEAVLKAAETLKLQEITANRVELWPLRQANPLRKSSGGRKS